MKRYRELIIKGDFYRLTSPYTAHQAAWMVISKDKRKALVGYYKLYNEANSGFTRLNLKGLNEKYNYQIIGKEEYNGDELMYVGLVISNKELSNNGGDFSSVIYELTYKG